MVLPGLLLTIVLGLLSQRVQARLRSVVYRRRALVLAGPLLLTCIFSVAAWSAGAFSVRLFLLVLAYTLAPTLCVLLPQGDLTAILLLWLPLEFAAGASLVPKAVQGYLHAVAYGVGIVLALWLFVIYRGLKGVKYNLSRSPRDLLYPAIGFAFLAPVLGVLGVVLGFMPHMHALHVAWYKAVLRYVTIFCATALPEEILFRGLIQNWLMQHFGSTNKTLLAAGFIFGCSHLNNGPLPLPNWRYMILATIAGVVFGKVFQKSSSILASVSLHAAVDTAKYAFFDTRISLRDQRFLWLEPAGVFLSIMLYIWWLRPGHTSWAFAIFGLVLLSHYWRGESLRDLGFRAANFRTCFATYLPALTFVTLTLLTVGILAQTLRVLDMERAIVGFLSYCTWGLFQQYLLNGFFVNRLQPVSSSSHQAATLGAAFFACAHTPNWFLMLVGFATGYCCARIWIRYRNLYFLGIAHGAIGSMLYLVVPDAISHHLVVGPGWFGH